ncbi:uncharacterized protein CLAFUR5_12659 [Fulvia fulva]|uniref:Uncharacterized protein n=1 Tax=Passalora fulva TaxID=5499 RepID=A0A9Q8UUV0_PASFU|nr:uncharacterized protein CLAFUR5_12659 [Fulvia fulva]UJO23364.1 hypothetical protein CLAFUR5_12659 [Fulvia fulva]WPV36448.1 hypothetical protein CLAFUW7_12799 [Fulvia fulva]
MAQTNVSSCVLSIIASLTSGLDVFRKFRESQSRKQRRSRKKNNHNETGNEDENRLAQSLRLGPEEIGREYQRSVYAAGEHFAQGDGIAQTSLAEILLKLNTGLVTIINTFLTRDKHDAKLDYQSLTNLSERSRDDTCRTLRQLFHRMTQSRVPSRLDGPRQKQDRPSNESAIYSRSRKAVPNARASCYRRLKRPSQVAMVRPGDKRKKSSSSTSTSKMQSSVSLALPESSTRETASRMSGGGNPPQTHRKQPAMDICQRPIHHPDALRSSRSTPVLDIAVTDHEQLPAYVAPLPPMPRRLQKSTPTYYSIDTTCTKLGEIPMHKWAEPYDFDAMLRLNKEAEENGWPLNNPKFAPEPKKRGGLFRLFRRSKEEV